MKITPSKLEVGLILKTLIQEREEEPKKTIKLLNIASIEYQNIISLRLKHLTMNNLLDLIVKLGYDVGITIKRTRFDEATITVQRK